MEARIESPAPTSGSERLRIFVSFDCEHDADLHDLLAAQAAKSSSGFEISARSRSRALADEGLRREIRAADAVITLCGEHTERSAPMGAELRIAQEEARPYVLLWGRRELMCTKPTTAKPADGMYSWTWEILQDQILTIRRSARSSQRLAELSRARTAAKSPAARPR